MNYVVMSARNYCEEPLELLLVKSGCGFYVQLSNILAAENEKVITRRGFSCMEDAFEVFQTLSRWMAFGLYSESYKRTYLESGMEGGAHQ